MPSRRQLNRRDRQLRIDDPMIQKAFAGHVMREEPMRAYRFHGVSLAKEVIENKTGAYPFVRYGHPTEKLKMLYTSYYAFSIKWTPGTLTLVGDLGEMTLSQYHAMPTFDEAILWVDRGDYHYLMGKSSNRERVPDWEGTFDYIMERANEYAAGWFKQIREERRRFRESLADHKARGEPEEEWPTEGDYELVVPPMVSKERHNHYGGSTWEWEAPDGWETWLKIWELCGGYGSPDEVYKAKNRIELREELMSKLQDASSETIADICVKLDLSDYYGSDKYKDQTVWQIAAIKHAARMLIEQGVVQQVARAA